MDTLNEYILKNTCCGRINEIIDITEKYFQKKVSNLSPQIKANILCSVMRITIDDLDHIIADHSEVSRTIKGHAFEVVFDAMMA